MRPGTTLHRIARLTCTRDRCDRVLEPALADLQHEWAASNSWWVLVRSYVAFWQSWGACVLRDAAAAESRSFSATVLTALALTVAVTASIELVLMHGSFAIRHLILSVPFRVVFAARSDTATLRYGVALAMGPALFIATWRTQRVAPAAYVTAAGLGIVLTVISSGYIAPALIRLEMIRQHDSFARWAAQAPSSSVRGWYVPPLDFSSWEVAESWPDLIRSAAEPPRHESALVPWYVTPDEAARPARDRQEIMERLLLIPLTLGSAVIGAAIGRAMRHPSKVDPIPRS